MKNSNSTKSTKRKYSSHGYRAARNPLLNFKVIKVNEPNTENIPSALKQIEVPNEMHFSFKKYIPKAKSKKGKPLVTKIKLGL